MLPSLKKHDRQHQMLDTWTEKEWILALLQKNEMQGKQQQQQTQSSHHQ